eukprot:5323403-Amphidinium_carterae.1
MEVVGLFIMIVLEALQSFFESVLELLSRVLLALEIFLTSKTRVTFCVSAVLFFPKSGLCGLRFGCACACRNNRLTPIQPGRCRSQCLPITAGLPSKPMMPLGLVLRPPQMVCCEAA